jgi:hypothetical protein
MRFLMATQQVLKPNGAPSANRGRGSPPAPAALAALQADVRREGKTRLTEPAHGPRGSWRQLSIRRLARDFTRTLPTEPVVEGMRDRSPRRRVARPT